MAIDALRANPNLHDYANLRDASKTDPGLKAYFDGGALEPLRNHIEQDAARHAHGFVVAAPWFHSVKGITDSVFKPIKSGVDTDGVRLDRENANIHPDYEQSMRMQWMQWAKTNLPQYANIEDLRAYANSAEAFLRDVGKLEGIRDPWISQQVAQVRECVTLARRAVEIFETDLPASGQPVNIRERAQELEHLLNRRK